MTQMSSNVPTKCPIMSLPTDCGKSIKISSQVPPGGLAECWQSSQPSDKRKSRQNPFYNKNVSITAKSTNSEKNVQNFHIFFPLATKWSFRTTPHRYFLSASRTNPPAVRRPFPFFFPRLQGCQANTNPPQQKPFFFFQPPLSFFKRKHPRNWALTTSKKELHRKQISSLRIPLSHDRINRSGNWQFPPHPLTWK